MAHHHQILIVLLLVSSFCVDDIHGNDWKQISEDTLMIEAADTPEDTVSTRNKRQIYLTPPLLLPSLPLAMTNWIRSEAAGSPPPQAQAGNSCVTPKGKKGVCARLRNCHPIMATFDLDDNGVYEGNVELARMLTDVFGSCHSNPMMLPLEEEVNFPPGEVTRDLVCCTGNVTRLNFPLISRPYIQNGVEASPGQYPAIVALMHGLFGGAKEFCGGSLIDKHNVLTAAHCIYGLDGQRVAKMTVQIGDHNLYSTRDGPHVVRKVSRIFYHKGYSNQLLHNDVALVRLATPVEFSARIKPIELASTTPPAGTLLNVAGWGRLLDNGQFPSNLRHASVPLISNQECKRKYGANTFGGILDSMLCTYSPKAADACQGDSGGPLMSGNTQVGLVSWGLGCGSYPGVYTRVSSFLPWIQKNQKQP